MDKLPQAPTSLRNQVDAKERKQVDEAYRTEAVVYVRMLLDQLIDQKLKAAEDQTEKRDVYEVANWQFLVADEKGYRRALKELKRILNVGNIYND